MSELVSEIKNLEKTRNKRYNSMVKKVFESNASLLQGSIFETNHQQTKLPMFKSNEEMPMDHGRYNSNVQFQTSHLDNSSSTSLISFLKPGPFVSNIPISQTLQQLHLQRSTANSDFHISDMTNALSTTTTEHYEQAIVPPRQYDEMERYKSRINVMLQACRDDKPFLKFISRLNESAMHVYLQKLHLPLQYTAVLEIIGLRFTADYGLQVLKGIGSSTPSLCCSSISNLGSPENLDVMNTDDKMCSGTTVENNQEEMARNNMSNMFASLLSPVCVDNSEFTHGRDASQPIPDNSIQSRVTINQADSKPLHNTCLRRRGRPRKKNQSFSCNLVKDLNSLKRKAVPCREWILVDSDDEKVGSNSMLSFSNDLKQKKGPQMKCNKRKCIPLAEISKNLEIKNAKTKYKAKIKYDTQEDKENYNFPYRKPVNKQKEHHDKNNIKKVTVVDGTYVNMKIEKNILDSVTGSHISKKIKVFDTAQSYDFNDLSSDDDLFVISKSKKLTVPSSVLTSNNGTSASSVDKNNQPCENPALFLDQTSISAVKSTQGGVQAVERFESINEDMCELRQSKL